MCARKRTGPGLPPRSLSLVPATMQHEAAAVASLYNVHARRAGSGSAPRQQEEKLYTNSCTHSHTRSVAWSHTHAVERSRVLGAHTTHTAWRVQQGTAKDAIRSPVPRAPMHTHTNFRLGGPSVAFGSTNMTMHTRKNKKTVKVYDTSKRLNIYSASAISSSFFSLFFFIRKEWKIPFHHAHELPSSYLVTHDLI